MAKEIYLYSGIYDFVAQDLIASMNDNMDEEIVMRQNSPGGSVFSAYGIAAKMVEHGNITMKVDGSAMSAGAMLLLFANKVEALDVAQIMLHRADMYVSSPEDQEFLDKVNKDLKAKLLLKVNAEEFKKITGHTINDMFDPKQRIDIFLSAKEAKAIGLVDKITKLMPSEVKAFNERMYAVAASADPASKKEIQKEHKNMTLAEFKAAHPEAYAQAVEVGRVAAIEAENDRVSAWMTFVEVDPKAVAAGIESGKALTQKAMADFSMKMMNATALSNVTADAAPGINTPEAGGVAGASAPTKQVSADFAAFRAEASQMSGVKLSAEGKKSAPPVNVAM